MRASILLWSTISGFVLGLLVGVLAFATLIVGSELASGAIPRLGGRARMAAALVSFVVVPLAGAVLGWLEGRLKLR